MRYLLILCNILFSLQNTSAQTNTKTILKGTVTVQGTGEFIPFADVILYQREVPITGTQTDFDGKYLFSNLKPGVYTIESRFLGFSTARIDSITVNHGATIEANIELSIEGELMDEVVVKAYKAPLINLDHTSSRNIVTAEAIKSLPTRAIHGLRAKTSGLKSRRNSKMSIRGSRSNATHYYIDGIRVDQSAQQDNTRVSKWFNKRQNPQTPESLGFGTEEYDQITEMGFKQAAFEPLSTFSIDVDRAAYSNVRRFLQQGQIPPADAVRIEEMINYFEYAYAQPTDEHPMAVETNLTHCPWNRKHKIMHIAMQARAFDKEEIPNSNLTFLIDVSGSMGSPNKLDLAIQSLQYLVDQLDPEDQVAIVTYAGSSGIALQPTKISNKTTILESLRRLRSGGSTAGAQGIMTAYKLAEEVFEKDRNNRVILLTDGDFNVGINTPNGLEKLIEKKRETGIYLSVLGFGMGNYKDNRMQTLADKGNGNHGYIDSFKEAKKIFGKEFAGTLHTIAKDVKLQIEFNPEHVKSYRLIGYENRQLENQDFNDDKKDAGEMGMNHCVTALYEIIPKNKKDEFTSSIDPLKYQINQVVQELSNETATVKIRYKQPDKKKSIKFEHVVSGSAMERNAISLDSQLALAITEWGLILRDSSFKKKASIDDVLSSLQSIHVERPSEELTELIDLVDIHKTLLQEQS